MFGHSLVLLIMSLIHVVVLCVLFNLPSKGLPEKLNIKPRVLDFFHKKEESLT